MDGESSGRVPLSSIIEGDHRDEERNGDNINDGRVRGRTSESKESSYYVRTTREVFGNIKSFRPCVEEPYDEIHVILHCGKDILREYSN